MGVPVKVWLGGEGRNELGGRGDVPPTERCGVIEALLRRVESDGWRVFGCTRWDQIVKYRAGVGGAEERNVLGLILRAAEERVEAVAFARDVDSDPDRAKKIEAAIEKAASIIKPPVPIVIIGGPAKPALEGWVLALHGVRDTDDMSRPRTRDLLVERGIEPKKTDGYVEVIDKADLGALPPGCESLRRWLDRAKQLTVLVHGVAPGAH